MGRNPSGGLRVELVILPWGRSLRKPNLCPHPSGLLLEQQPPFLHTLSGQHLPSSRSHRKSAPQPPPPLVETLCPRPGTSSGRISRAAAAAAAWEPLAGGGGAAPQGGGRGRGERGCCRGTRAQRCPAPRPAARSWAAVPQKVTSQLFFTFTAHHTIYLLDPLKVYSNTKDTPHTVSKNVHVPPEQNANVSNVNCCYFLTIKSPMVILSCDKIQQRRDHEPNGNFA